MVFLNDLGDFPFCAVHILMAKIIHFIFHLIKMGYRIQKRSSEIIDMKKGSLRRTLVDNEIVVFYCLIGKIIGRLFVFSYKKGASVSVISFLISDHCVVFRSITFDKCFVIKLCASLIKSPDSLM